MGNGTGAGSRSSALDGQLCSTSNNMTTTAADPGSRAGHGREPLTGDRSTVKHPFRLVDGILWLLRSTRA